MARRPSVMNHSFSQVPRADIPRSRFDRSHGYKTTFNPGFLVPVYLDEALPGDTFNMSMTSFSRLATPLHPVMDNMYLDSFFFAVPIRLLWDNWQRFNGEQTDPGDSTDYLVPTMTSPAVTGYSIGSLEDVMGLPTGIPDLEHSALFHRAYNLIYNEWFRDENLQDSAVINRGDGPDSIADYPVRRRGKRHDYFTSALPWPQKGPAVPLPLAGDAPVFGIGKVTQTFVNAGVTVYETAGAASTGYANASRIDPSGPNFEFMVEEDPNNTGYPGIYADLSQVSAATINQLRQAFQIQRLYERDARGGTRYIEILKSHFGVTSPDARLQRPEYLGGGSAPVNISPIAQTSSTDVTTPQGNLAAIGTVTQHGHGFTKSFTEHCIIIGMVSARADLNYQQGLNRMWSRQTRWDFYWPALAHIGEQAIKNKEIYAQGSVDPVADEAVFGYQERWAEYRYKPSQISGQFRSTYSSSLDTWHLAQEFTSLPVLNDTFIQENPPISRVIAVPSQPAFLFDAYFKLNCARPMPMYSVPGLIDHF